MLIIKFFDAQKPEKKSIKKLGGRLVRQNVGKRYKAKLGSVLTSLYKRDNANSVSQTLKALSLVLLYNKGN